MSRRLRTAFPSGAACAAVCLGLGMAAALTFQAGVVARAQAPAATDRTFEVASIRRNKQAEERRAVILAQNPDAAIAPGRAQTRPGGNVTGTGMTLRELVRDAYGYRNRAASDVTGGPGWVDSERYDIQAKASTEFPPSSIVGLAPEAEPYLRALLAERFKLKVRIDKRERPAYELVMARGDRRPGQGLQPSKGGCRNFYNAQTLAARPGEPAAVPLPPCPFALSTSGFIAGNVTMQELALFLAAFPQVNALVIDKTDLPGAFDITITNPAAADVSPGAPAPLPALPPLLEGQLGLRLRRVEALVDVLVIEEVERPTDN